MNADELELFTTSNCGNCDVLKNLLQGQGVSYIERVVDLDPIAETDALILEIYSVPVLRRGNALLRAGQIFRHNEIDEDAVRAFLNQASSKNGAV